MAVLEKRMGMFLQNQDAYLNVAGGVKLVEPAVDLAVAVSLVSSFRDQADAAVRRRLRRSRADRRGAGRLARLNSG